jgi:hypothetical protein
MRAVDQGNGGNNQHADLDPKAQRLKLHLPQAYDQLLDFDFHATSSWPQRNSARPQRLAGARLRG